MTHFLVVDDDPESLGTLVEYLRAQGHQKITQCRDGAEAIRAIERDPTINFVISDWDMPLLNGHTLLQRVRSHPTRANLPFVIVTSPISQETEKIILAAESMVDAYLIKPFRSEAFRAKIEQVLENPVHGPQKQVLVVDDDPDARETVIEYLAQFGFKDIHGVENGRLAASYLAANASKVGLIVSDWEMPEVSGLELLQSCKGNPALAEIPFLMVTSQSSIERIKVMQAAKANVDQYLLKPFRADEIKKRIETLLEKSRSRGEVRRLVAEGIEHFEHNRHKRAQECLESALALDPEYDVALRALGDVLMKVKGVETALPFYRKAVELNPAHAKGYIRLAMAYEQIGWVDKAASTMELGVGQVSFNADLHFHLGRIYNKKGASDLARAEFEKALEIQLDHQEARLMLEMIQRSQKG